MKKTLHPIVRQSDSNKVSDCSHKKLGIKRRLPVAEYNRLGDTEQMFVALDERCEKELTLKAPTRTRARSYRQHVWQSDVAQHSSGLSDHSRIPRLPDSHK